MVKKRGLGRDLDSLLSGIAGSGILSAPTSTVTLEPKQSDGLRQLSVEMMQRGRYQPRQDMEPEALAELAESIKEQGLIQPIVVRAISDKKYEIIAGERRWRASQLAGLLEVPVIIKEFTDEAAMAVSLIENIQREDLNPLEKAYALKRLMDECGLMHDQLAKTIGKSRATVTNLLRLLHLNADVKKLLENGDIEMGHARALLALEGQIQSHAANTVVGKELSVRDTEKLVKNLLSGRPLSSKKTPPPLDPDVRRLQDDLSDKLGAKVIIQHSPKGKGKLIIQYFSLEEFEGVLQHIR